MLAFLSYQTAEKHKAGKVQMLLKRFGVNSFMAHEDIDISLRWQEEILRNLREADIFIALLSKAYLASFFCVQEAGMAIMREKEMRIIPLSLDGTVSPGFMGHIQSRRVKDEDYKGLLLSAFAGFKPHITVDFLIHDLEGSSDFRGAEARFAALNQYIGIASDNQKLKILKISLENGQISHASICARSYLPPLLSSHGHLMDENDRQKLAERISQYQK